MPNEDTATPETKLTAMCERTIQQLDEVSEKLDAYCRELENRAETRAETPVEKYRAPPGFGREPKTPRRERWFFVWIYSGLGLRPWSLRQNVESVLPNAGRWSSASRTSDGKTFYSTSGELGQGWRLRRRSGPKQIARHCAA